MLAPKVYRKRLYYWRSRLLGQQAEQQTVKEPEFHPVKITPANGTERPERVSILLRLPNGVECELQHLEVGTCFEVLDQLALVRT
jgi:hypothetical protein